MAARLPLPSAGLAVALLLGSAPAQAAPTKAECVDAHTKAQELRRDGKLSAARAALHACGAPGCPALVRSDCALRLNDLDQAQPTLVFDAKDPSGADVSAVKVTVDGEPLTERLDGSAVKVDPGEHVFEFAMKGQPPVTKKLVLAEGDKGRREHIVFASPKVASATPPSASLSTPPPPAADETSSHGKGLGTLKILGLTAGGLGVAGIAAGGVFGLLTGSAWNTQKNDCASPTSCTNHTQAVSDHSTAMTDSTISTVAFIAGGALLAGGAALYFAGSGSSEKAAAPTTSLLVVPSVGPDGAGLLFRGGL